MLREPFGKHLLKLDAEAESARIAAGLSEAVKRYRRHGAVVALSGGIDSSVTAALAVKALGRERVFGLHMPEKDSSADTLRFSRMASSHFGIDSAVEEITSALESLGCYRRRDDAIRTVIPGYGEGWKCKMVIPNVIDNEGFNFFHLVGVDPAGNQTKVRLSLESYLGVVAATNFKQRVRKMLEYHHADRLHYITTGTPNRLEYDQGFFVKLGDAAADVKPIAHLYKTQVYQLAEFLGVPEEIRRRAPTTDTYSMEQGQDEFYFSLPYDRMDLCLYGKNNGYEPSEVAEAAGLRPSQAERVYKDIDTKRNTTRYLHAKPLLLASVPEIQT